MLTSNGEPVRNLKGEEKSPNEHNVFCHEYFPSATEEWLYGMLEFFEYMY